MCDQLPASYNGQLIWHKFVEERVAVIFGVIRDLGFIYVPAVSDSFVADSRMELLLIARPEPQGGYVTALLDQQMATDQIRCKSNECLRNIQGESTYRPSIKHLRTYVRIEHPLNIQQTSIENPSKIYCAHTCAHLCTLVHTCAPCAHLCTLVHTCACTHVHTCAHLCTCRCPLDVP